MEVIVNISNTQYEVIEEIIKDLNWKCTTNPEDTKYDIFWQDNALSPENLAQLSTYQRINHFPGIQTISRKDELAKNLKSMQKIFPLAYNFFPKTWVLPRDFADLKVQFSNKKPKTYICKPEALSQGKGIFLTRKLEDIPEKCVVQRYKQNPYLIDGLKFDLRVYVLLLSCDPLKIYVHKEGLVRFATETYLLPSCGNLGNVCMHLTNYAINKENPKFQYNSSLTEDFKGHKRSLKKLFEYLAENGINTQQLWMDIEDIITKTICVAQPALVHLYKASQPNDPTGAICFQVLGFDILINNKLKPILLEVNHTPSFATESPLDIHVKKNVISDALKMLGIQQRIDLSINEARHTMRCKDIKIFRQELKEKWLQSRETVEENHHGGYKKIYPNIRTEFQDYLKAAKTLWINQLGARKRKENSSGNIKVFKSKFISKKIIRKSIFERTAITPHQIKSSNDISNIKIKSTSRPPISLKNYGCYVRPKLFEFSKSKIVLNKEFSKQG
ncbi:hypothetical protein SteCoe_3500 [Stentor coeruleus]|uniref:Tubulin-tyrosine ligase family protein n=1 Tax=Stentor coeruleus TaxID=5963 RepID=A0A1R2CWY5_9CILI|nr:hypothetical protein SteCoe_3500 [Stentor coeruleus]